MVDRNENRNPNDHTDLFSNRSFEKKHRPFRIWFGIPVTISSLIYAGTGCTNIPERRLY